MQISLIVALIFLSMLSMVQFRCDLNMMLFCLCYHRMSLERTSFEITSHESTTLERTFVKTMSVKTFLKRISYPMSKSISVAAELHVVEPLFSSNSLLCEIPEDTGNTRHQKTSNLLKNIPYWILFQTLT